MFSPRSTHGRDANSTTGKCAAIAGEALEIDGAPAPADEAPGGSARKDLAERLQVFVSESARNQTGLGFDQVTGLIEALSNDADPELFPDGCGVGRGTPRARRSSSTSRRTASTGG